MMTQGLDCLGLLRIGPERSNFFSHAFATQVLGEEPWTVISGVDGNVGNTALGAEDIFGQALL
jgi:hypothetical protein